MSPYLGCDDERVQCDRAFAARIDDDRIEIDLADRRFVEEEAADGPHDPDERFDVERRRTAKAFEKRAALELPNLRRNLCVGHIGRDQARILEDFGLYAAEADDHDGPPFRVIAAPDDELNAGRAHRFDQDALESEARPAAFDIVCK